MQLKSLKVTTWNLEHCNRLITDNPSEQIVDRRNRIWNTLESIDPDVICLQEGPKGSQAIQDFCKQVFKGRYVPVLLPTDNDRDYQLLGSQWIWFVVKSDLADRCYLQDPDVWQTFTEEKSWKVHQWGEEISNSHKHYRHPQVMVMNIDGEHEIEFIGVHLKSKINKKKIVWENGDLTGEYVNEALKARIKLATESANVRKYIHAKFEQLEHPGIVLLGDCNDPVGKDHFEKYYMFFDLISNLQGEVLMSERFFNHALFDYPNHLRWTCKYRDAIKKIPASKNPLLIDHILMSQPIVKGRLPLKAAANAGLVEHQSFERHNAGSNSKTRTSDHRPVSLVLTA